MSSSQSANNLSMLPESVPACWLAALMDRSDEAVAVIDCRRDLILWQSAAFLDWFPVGAAGNRWSSLCACVPEMDEFAGRHLEDALSSGEVLQLPVSLTGDRQRASMMFVPFDRTHFGISLSQGTHSVSEIHAYLKAHDNLFSTSRAISVSEMATTLAHEINQPIGTIVNLLHGIDGRLRGAGHTSEEVHAAISRALEQARFSAKIIARIRDFTEARKPRQEVIDITALMREAIDLVHWLTDASRCRIELCTESATMPIVGDATMLQQVFVNLLRNAIESMSETPPEDRLVQIRLAKDKGRLNIVVDDAGCGLAKEGKELFVPFASTKPDGMGVGLNICRSFIELHEGRLWMTTNACRGCSARISLPVSVTDAGGQPSELAPSDTASADKRASS